MDSSEAMDRSHCLRLLAQHSVGRVVFTERALPAIRLVDYALIGTDVVLRTGADGLGRRLDGQVVAFEVDQIDQGHAAAWSVVLRPGDTKPDAPGRSRAVAHRQLHRCAAHTR